MRVFLTGASGWIGSVVWRELIAAGHDVIGLVRSEANGAARAEVLGTVLVGSLADRDVLRRGAEGADGIIHTAFGLDMSRIGELATEDRQAIEFFGELFAGSTRPIIVTDGFLNVTGDKAREDDRPAIVPAFPRASQQTAFALAERGIHASVVRNPARFTGTAKPTASCLCWPPLLARRACLLMSATAATFGLRSTGWTLQGSTASRSNAAHAVRLITRWPRKAFPSARSPKRLVASSASRQDR